MTSVTRRAGEAAVEAVASADTRDAPSVNRGTASPIASPTSRAAWMAAPSATTSSTLTPARGGLPDICET